MASLLSAFLLFAFSLPFAIGNIHTGQAVEQMCRRWSVGGVDVRVRLPVIVLVLCVGSATASWANPSPGFGECFLSIRWIVKTMPLNYAADLAALALALWAGGNAASIAWRMIPVYAVPVFLAGYTADFGARYLTQGSFHDFDMLLGYPADRVSASLGLDQPVAMLPEEANRFMGMAVILLFVLNLLIIWGLLRLSDADRYDRLPLSAGIMAVLTAPYLSIHGYAKAAALPALMFGLSAGVFLVAKMGLTALRRVREGDRQSTHI